MLLFIVENHHFTCLMHSSHQNSRPFVTSSTPYLLCCLCQWMFYILLLKPFSLFSPFTVLTYLPEWSKIKTKFSEQNVYGCSTLNRISSELYRNECITALLSIGKWFYKKPSDAQQDEGWKIRLNRIYMNVFSSALHAICRVYSRSIKIQLVIFCYVFSSNYIL